MAKEDIVSITEQEFKNAGFSDARVFTEDDWPNISNGETVVLFGGRTPDKVRYGEEAYVAFKEIQGTFWISDIWVGKPYSSREGVGTKWVKKCLTNIAKQLGCVDMQCFALENDIAPYFWKKLGWKEMSPRRYSAEVDYEAR